MQKLACDTQLNSRIVRQLNHPVPLVPQVNGHDDDDDDGLYYT